MIDHRPFARWLLAACIAFAGPGVPAAETGGNRLAEAMVRMMDSMGMLGQGSTGAFPGAGPLPGGAPQTMPDPRNWSGWWPGQIPFHAPGTSPAYPGAGLDGLWVSQGGERLLIRGQGFRLHAGGERYLEGLIQVRGNLLAMRASGTDQTWFYEYAHQDGRLALKDANGQLYLYRRSDAPEGRPWFSGR